MWYDDLDLTVTAVDCHVEAFNEQKTGRNNDKEARLEIIYGYVRYNLC